MLHLHFNITIFVHV